MERKELCKAYIKAKRKIQNICDHDILDVSTSQAFAQFAGSCRSKSLAEVLIVENEKELDEDIIESSVRTRNIPELLIALQTQFPMKPTSFVEEETRIIEPFVNNSESKSNNDNEDFVEEELSSETEIQSGRMIVSSSTNIGPVLFDNFIDDEESDDSDSL